MSFPAQIPAAVPKTVDGYIGYLSQQITRANDHWQTFSLAASGAYATAYKNVNNILTKIRDTTDADKAYMAYLLSLLTVGVAGAAASFIRIETKAALETAARDVVKQLVKTGGGSASGAALDALSPGKNSDVFAPSDVDPTEYLAKILYGISRRKALLDDILDAAQWDPNTSLVKMPDSGSSSTSVGVQHGNDGRLTLSSAKLLTETILNTSYFQQMPSLDLDAKDLLPKAQLALWIGWALNRDANYWSDGEQDSSVNIIAGPGGGGANLGDRPSDATYEQPKWVKVRDDLVRLKVPPGSVTSTLKTSVWTGNKMQYGLYMWGFMSWASSAAAFKLMLDDSVRSQDTMAVQTAYMGTSRKILSPKDIHNPHWIKVPDPVVTPIEQ